MEREPDTITRIDQFIDEAHRDPLTNPEDQQLLLENLYARRLRCTQRDATIR